jgi:hypothetical protein
MKGNDLFYRSFDLKGAQLNEKKRTVELSFSSEMPIKRWFGNEILLHGEKNVDLSRLRSVGSFLYGHGPQEMKNVIGPLHRVWLESRRGKAIVGFDKDETGETALQKIKSGSLRGVSFAYQILKARELKKGEEWQDPETAKDHKGPALIATRWQPYEISLTPVPADPSVGVGRTASRNLSGIEIKTNRTPGSAIADAIADEIKKRRKLSEEWSFLRARAAALLGEEAEQHVNEMIKTGRSVGQVQEYILDAFIQKKKGNEMSANNHHKVVRKMSEIGDEEFARMVTRRRTGGLVYLSGDFEETTAKNFPRSIDDIPEENFIRMICGD